MTRTTPSGTFAHVPAFAAAAPALQDAIVALIEAAPKDADGNLTLYPARDAWMQRGYAREVQQVSPDTAAYLLAHIPPPFYTTPEAVAAGRLLTELSTT